MKRMSKTLVTLALALALILSAAGCKKEESSPSEPNFSLDSRDNTVLVTGTGGNRGSGGVGYITIGDEEALLCRMDCGEGEKVGITIYPYDETGGPASYSDPSKAIAPPFEISETPDPIWLDPGEYAILVEGVTDFTGTVEFTAVPRE